MVVVARRARVVQEIQGEAQRVFVPPGLYVGIGDEVGIEELRRVANISSGTNSGVGVAVAGECLGGDGLDNCVGVDPVQAGAGKGRSDAISELKGRVRLAAEGNRITTQ